MRSKNVDMLHQFVSVRISAEQIGLSSSVSTDKEVKTAQVCDLMHQVRFLSGPYHFPPRRLPIQQKVHRLSTGAKNGAGALIWSGTCGPYSL
jgi:hypothetical protein